MKIHVVCLAVVLLSNLFAVIRSAVEDNKVQVEPLSKVLDMLNDLKLKVVNEEKKAYILYAEYNALCDKKFKATTWLIETDNEEISELTAELDSEFAAISEMAEKIEELVTTIAQSNLELKNITRVRESEAHLFQEEQEELTEMIRMLRKAIEVLGSKEGASMLQLDRTTSIAHALEVMVQAALFSSQDAQKLTALVQTAQQAKDDDDSEDGAAAPAAVYQKQTGDIVDTLKDTLDKAEEQQKDGEAAEATAQHNFDMLSQQLKMTLARCKKEMAEIRGEKSEADAESADFEGKLREQKQKLTVDEKTRKLSDQECKDNANAFRAESKERENEITAILKAIKALERATGLKRITTTPAPDAFVQTTDGPADGCAASQYGCCSDGVTAKDDSAGINCGAQQFKQMEAMVHAMQQMQFLQVKSSAAKHALHEQVQQISFLQMNNKANSAAMATLHQVVQVLARTGQRVHSDSISQLAIRITQIGSYAPVSDLNNEFSVNTKTFRKVKNLIMDMIEKLEDEADAEKDEHAYCDEQMGKTAKDIKEKKALRDEAEQRYNAALNAYSKCKREVVEIGKSLTLGMNQSGLEADLRDKTHALYLKEKEENERAKAGVQEAMKTLREYYGNDAATTDTDASVSILKLMELILTDIEKTLAALEADEAQEAADFKKSEQQYELDEATYQQDQKHRTSKLPELEKKVSEARRDLEAAQAELDDVYKIWDALKERCTFKKDGFEERIAKIEKELEGLEEALDILKQRGSGAVFLQTGSHRSLRGLLRHSNA